MKWLLAGVLIAWILGVCALPLRTLNAAGSKNNGSSARQTKAARAQSPKERQQVTPEREAAAITFAKHNAPQLIELLDYLRRKRPRQYRRAILDLFHTSERLATIQERDPERYALELEIWKTKSRMEVIAARMQVRDSKQLRTQLKTATRKLIAMHRALLERDRKRIRQRLDRLDLEIESLDPDDETVVRQHMDAFLQRRGRGRHKKKK